MNKARPEWVYNIQFGKWMDIRTGECGKPQKGDWYLDYNEWRIW